MGGWPVDLLSLKQLAVGTPVEGVLRRLRWVRTAPHRRRHPELQDFFLEDERTRHVIRSLVHASSCVVDVGAHLGSMLSEILRLAPDGRHIAIEPMPAMAAGLRRRFPQVEVIEAATSDRAGTATFHVDRKRTGFSSLRQPPGATDLDEIEVAVITLDEVLADRSRVDFIKIDVEGAELPSLRGAEATLSRHRPPVLFECGLDSRLEDFGYRRMDLYEFFIERDYEVHSMIDAAASTGVALSPEAFEQSGVYPYPGFNFLALSAG